MKRYPHIFAAVLLALALTLCVSCRIGPPLPPADFSTPGWQVHQGQAVWKPTKKRPELAGDLLLATNANGDYMVQFTKSPLILATAQVSDESWQIDFGAGLHVFRGRGHPPKRFSWFQLPRALAGRGVQRPWKLTQHSDGSWRLENSRTGESLEGFISP